MFSLLRDLSAPFKYAVVNFLMVLTYIMGYPGTFISFPSFFNMIKAK